MGSSYEVGVNAVKKMLKKKYPNMDVENDIDIRGEWDSSISLKENIDHFRSKYELKDIDYEEGEYAQISEGSGDERISKQISDTEYHTDRLREQNKQLNKRLIMLSERVGDVEKSGSGGSNKVLVRVEQAPTERKDPTTEKYWARSVEDKRLPKAQDDGSPSFLSKFSKRSVKPKSERKPEVPIKRAVSKFIPKPMPTTAQKVFGAKVGLNHRALLGFLPYEERDTATHLKIYGFDKHETHNVMERAINPAPSGRVDKWMIGSKVKRGIRGDNVLKW